MQLGIEEYVHLDSALHRWDARYKLVGLTTLIFGFSFVQDLRLLPAMLMLTALLFTLSRLPLSFLLSRLRYPGVFLLILAVLLPLLSGSSVLLRIGPLALRQEGCLELLVIVCKFVSILTLSLILFGSAPFLTTIKAMLALGLPAILADMTLLSYRYIYEIGDDLRTMETAMGLRGFRARRLSRRSLGVLAALSGSILVRSYERSERIYKAMILRGHSHARRPPDAFQAHTTDAAALVVVLFVAAGFVTAEIILRG